MGKLIKNTFDAVGDLINDPLRAIKHGLGMRPDNARGIGEENMPVVPPAPPPTPIIFNYPEAKITPEKAKRLETLKDLERKMEKSGTMRTGARGVDDESLEVKSLLGSKRRKKLGDEQGES